MSLFWGTREGQNVASEEIAEIIKKELIIIALPQYALDAILPRLLSKGTVSLTEEKKYSLKNLKRKEIAGILEKSKSKTECINECVVAGVVREFGQDLSLDQKEETLANFYLFLASIFLERSNLVAKIVTSKEIGVIPIEFPSEILIEILAKTRDPRTARAQKKAFERLFREASEPFIDFLFSAIQNLVCLQVLNLDPECKSLEKEAFKSKVLFLDTNVLMALLCPTDPMSKVAKDFVDLTKSLGSNCYVTERTMDEYSLNLEEANSTYKNWRGPHSLFEHADNEFLASYWEEKKRNPTQNWAGYYYRMKSIESLLGKMGIIYFKEEHKEIFEKEYFQKVSNQVYRCCLAIKRRKKSRNVCLHDAYHLLLIRELRKKEENPMLGPNNWFATGDETLFCVDNLVNSLTGDRTPSSMLCSIWLDMIAPFLPVTIRNDKARDVFSGFIRQQFSVMPFEIRTEDLVLIQGDWLNYDWLEPTDVVRIMNKEWAQQYMRKIRWAKIGKASIPQMEELASAFSTRLKEELKSLQDEKMKRLQTQINGMSQQVQTLQTEQMTMGETIKKQQLKINEQQLSIENQKRSQKTEEKFKLFMRAAIGIGGLVLLLSPVLLICFRVVPFEITSVLYYAVSFVMGAISLFIAIAYERVKVWLGAKLNLSLERESKSG